MSQVSPGWESQSGYWPQALFANPESYLLDEPTNNLDIYTFNWFSLRWLNLKRKSTYGSSVVRTTDTF